MATLPIHPTIASGDIVDPALIVAASGADVVTSSFQNCITVLRNILSHTHTGTSGPGGINNVDLNSRLTSLAETKYRTSVTVTAADINELISIYNALLQHNHVISGSTTTGVDGASVLSLPQIAPNQDVTASVIDQLFQRIRNYADADIGHTHTYFTGSYVYAVGTSKYWHAGGGAYDSRNTGTWYSASPAHKPGSNQLYPIHTYVVAPTGGIRVYVRGACDDYISGWFLDGANVGSLGNFSRHTTANSNVITIPEGVHVLTLRTGNGSGRHGHYLRLFNYDTGAVLCEPNRWFRGARYAV